MIHHCQRISIAATLALLTLAATSDATALVSAGLRTRIEAERGNVFRFEVARANVDDKTDAAPLTIGDATLSIEEGSIVIRRNDRIAWQGTLRPLDTFGRAQVPGIEIAWNAHPDERIYGLGERFDRFDQAGKRVDLWIEDAPGQGDRSARTYYAAPVAYSSAGYALFTSDNPESVFDLNSGGDGVNRVQRAGEKVTFYVAVGDSLVDLIDRRTAIQGRPRNVPAWTFGPWISRNSYEKQSEAEEAIRGHLDRGNPVAAIVQEAWKGSSETGDFNNFSKERWPDVESFFAMCKQHDIRNVLWQVPIIHPSSPFFEEGKAKGYFVKKPDGSISFRREWLAGFANIDFTNPDAVKWWKDMMRNEVRMGVFGYKADDGEDIKPDDVFHDGRRGWEMHNEYSRLYARALTELFDEENVRGILWSRSGSLGIEQYPGLWAGDQFADWQQLRSLIPAGLSSGISGMPFWGHDIGGYIGDCPPELYVRWLQMGTLSPFMQYHGIKPREPWFHGPDADEAYKLLSRLRMNLKPTLVALGDEANKTGLPLMRPMVLHYPDDTRFGGDDTQYMLGRDLLVAPVLQERMTGRLIKFPAGRWHHAIHPIAFEGPGEIEVPIGMIDAPLFVRDGATLPVQLAEGKQLGEWSKDAPPRALRFSEGRVAIENLRAPLIGDPIQRAATVTFDVTPNFTGPITVTWHWSDQPDQAYKAKQERTGNHVSVDLTPPANTDVLGRRQVYVIAGPAPSRDAPRLNFRGEIDWSSPVTVELADALQAVGGDATEKQLSTTLHNRSGRAIDVKLSADQNAGASVTPQRDSVNVPAHGEAKVDWHAKVDAAGGSVGDARVRLRASASGVELGAAEAIFVRPGRWIAAGPFPAALKAAHATRYAPEWSQAADVVFATRDDKRVQWRQVPTDHLAQNNGINFAGLFGEREQAAAYAMTVLDSDRAQPAQLRFGSDDTLRVWLNGELVHSVETYRGAEPDQEIVDIQLKQGKNVLLTKVAQDVGGWQMIFRVTGPKGARISGVTDGFDEATWGAYAEDREPSKTIIEPPKPYAWRVLGPIKAVPSAESDWKLPSDEQAVSAAASYKPVPADAAEGNRIDLNQLLGTTANAVAYVATDITVDQPTDVTLVSGSDDGLVLWLNGKLVHRADEPRMFSPESDRIRLHLKPGQNTLVGRVSQGGGDWIVQMQLLDKDQKPISGK